MTDFRRISKNLQEGIRDNQQIVNNSNSIVREAEEAINKEQSFLESLTEAESHLTAKDKNAKAYLDALRQEATTLIETQKAKQVEARDAMKNPAATVGELNKLLGLIRQ